MVAVAAVPTERESYQYEGLYAPSEAAGYLLVGIPNELQQRARPTPRRLQGWIREGLLAPEERVLPGRERTLDFDDLISAQVITLLQQRGEMRLRDIKRAENYFAKELGVAKPFARHDFWYSRSDLMREYDETSLVSGVRAGQLGVKDLLIPIMGRLSSLLRFESGSGRPLEWEPAEGITLAPDIQFGHACLKDTRIPTSAIWSYVHGGDREEFIAESYGISGDEVSRAVRFEDEVRRALAEVTGVSTVSD